jgi:type I restriction enzyme S subunit
MMLDDRVSDAARSWHWDIPASWAWTTMGDVTTVVGGGTPATNDSRNFHGGHVPWVTPADLSGYSGATIACGDRFLTTRGLESCSATLLPKGSVLLSSRAPVGYVVIASQSLCTNQGFKSFPPCDALEARYLYFQLIRSRDLIRSLASGTTFMEISAARCRQIPVVIAPLREQAAIADKIESLFSELDAGVAALERVKRNLVRYRAAVLHAAVTGQLTASWRERNGPPSETGQQLLERILIERRRIWEERTLAKYQADGKQPPKGWKERFRSPVAAKPHPVSVQLPPSWVSTSVDSLIWDSGYGTSVRCDYESDGAPVLRIPNIARGELDLADIKHATESLGLADQSEFLGLSDILVCRTNGSIRLIGKAAVVTQAFSHPTYFASYLIRLRAVDLDLARYLHLAITSHYGRAFIEANAASSAGQHNVSMTTLQQMSVPLPPTDEIAAILECCSERLSQIEALEAEVARGLARATRLRQSILKSAFEGHLVPQAPADEPASVLIERIRAASLPSAAKKPRKTNARKTAKT